jgi:hypothetical protein
MMITEKDFRKDVVDAFRSLEALGFRCSTASSDSVRLENDKVVVEVHYDHRRSFEVGVELSLKGSHPGLEVYSLRDVFRESGVPDADRHSFFQSQDYELAIQFLNETATLLASYSRPILLGEIQSFIALEDRQSREAKAYTLSIQLAGVRKQADVAWHKQSYRDFIDLLENYQEVLPESDRKKLEYARHKVLGD